MGIIFALLLTVLTLDGEYPGHYQEPIEASRPIRQREFDQIADYAQRLNAGAPARRDAFVQPDYGSVSAYEQSIAPLRARVRERIGFPPPMIKRGAEPRFEHVADDSYASIYRVWLEVLEGVESYGILSIPHGLKGRAPLMICQHGGGGSPEIIQPTMPTAGNYGWMVQRALQEGYVTYAPALIFNIGGNEPIEGPNRLQLDQQLRNVGTSIMAVEVWKICRAIDVVSARPEVDRSRIAMMGLSYGGLYTLYTTALEPRIKVAVSSCYFNERNRYAWQDWSFFNYFNEFNDAEICALICPRPLMVEVGINDELFAVEGARAEYQRARRFWDGLNLSDRFVMAEFDGGHEFRGDGAFEFVKRYVSGQ
ncbi:MAG: S9 family peptidase [Candidatus Hydrogenedentes bacterium]|nr:S9 family peptidase [Candidatus Hydrogenedentota bacterium]